MQAPRPQDGTGLMAMAHSSDRNDAGRRELRERLNASQGIFYSLGATVAQATTPYQAAELVETPALGRVLLLDGVTQVSERWEERYHEPLVHPALFAHPDPRRVLVLGGGDGGTLREILRHKTVESVDFVELDPEVVAFCKASLPSVHRGAFDDPRVSFRYGDGRAFVESTASRYDAVIMDMTDPAGPARFLYTEEFFRSVASLLSDERGVFSMHGESPAARPAAFACIGATLRAVFRNVDTALAFVPMYGTLWSYRYASREPGPAGLPPAELAERVAARLDAPLRFASQAMWPALFAPDPIVAQAESHVDARVITDALPDFPDAFES